MDSLNISAMARAVEAIEEAIGIADPTQTIELEKAKAWVEKLSKSIKWLEEFPEAGEGD